MAMYLPGTAEDQALALDEMMPRQIIAAFDKTLARLCLSDRIK